MCTSLNNADALNFNEIHYASWTLTKSCHISKSVPKPVALLAGRLLAEYKDTKQTAAPTLAEYPSGVEAQGLALSYLQKCP